MSRRLKSADGRLKESGLEHISNMVYIDFVYGLAFFSLGLVIGLESLRPINPAIKPAFRNLAAFGLLYAVHQWTEFILEVTRSQTHLMAMVIFDLTVMSLGVFFLARFSAMLISDNRAFVTLLPLGLLVLWTTLVGAESGLLREPETFHLVADDLARYILILPANLLAAWGLLRGTLFSNLGNGSIRQDKRILGALFAANAVFSGILVSRAPFPPANWLDVESFLNLTGVPVPVVRGLLAVGITIFMVRALRVFEFAFLKDRLAKETMERDAKVAAEIQLELVPKAPLRVEGAQISARLIPARFVGGDTFDYFATNRVLTFMIGDASGKGSPAALLSTAGLITLETELRSEERLIEILGQANKRLTKRFPPGSFMTAAMGRYFPETKTIEIASSGQNPPLIYRGRDRVWRLVDLEGSLPLGVERSAVPVEAGLAMETGDRLLYYTDGLVDVRTTQGSRIKFELILDWLNANADLDSEEMLDGLVDLLLDISGGELYDDVALLLLNIDGISASAEAAA